MVANKRADEGMPGLRGGALPTVGVRVRTPDKRRGVVAWTQRPDGERYTAWTSVVQFDDGPGKRYRTAELAPVR